MHLAAARVFVTDLGRSIEWYRNVIGASTTAEDLDAGYAVFDVGADLVLEVVGADSEISAGDLIGRFTGLSFAVADVRATFAALAAEADVVGEPELQTWGGTLATIADLDGNQIQLVQYPPLAIQE